MPIIKSSTDLRNNYNDLSSHCNQTGEPIFITKNGRGDLAIMSIESYNKLIDRFELSKLLEEAEEDFKNGRILNREQAINSVKEDLINGRL